MHGAGNDFIMIDDLGRRFEESKPLIESLCRDHTGIGADGLILLRPDDSHDFRMLYFNKDGGAAEMCGNGARCAARFAFINKIAGKKMSFSTGAEDVMAEILDAGVRIRIGDVIGYAESVDLKDSGEKTGFAICGVPHAAQITDDARN